MPLLRRMAIVLQAEEKTCGRQHHLQSSDWEEARKLIDAQRRRQAEKVERFGGLVPVSFQ